MSYLFAFKNEQGKYLDYALDKCLNSNNYGYNRILVGERIFLYHCFEAVFSNGFNEEEKNLFYYYILVKNRFRCELVQSNNQTGFKNFARYQDRKGAFYYRIDEYEREAIRLSLNDTLNSQNIESLEARIMPEMSPSQLESSINFYDECYNKNQKGGHYRTIKHAEIFEFETYINNKYEADKFKYFYVLHYPKNNNTFRDTTFCVPKPKNYKQRNNNVRFSKSIAVALSENNCLRSRIRGIDTCAYEISCRPEVFATDYRYLRGYNSKDSDSIEEHKNFLHLGRTYHVGEDFFDIVDGLRAIDEVKRFLDFSYGDRLGHALALGIKPVEHYAYKNFKIILPKQEALDNFVWLYFRANELNVSIEPILKQELENRINALSNEIYKTAIDLNIEITPYKLYSSWKLRGDAPELYFTSKFKAEKFCVDQYENAKFVSTEELNVLRYNEDIAFLYYSYHYDVNARCIGEEIYELHADSKYINLVSEIQKKLQIEICKSGIMIECNPSSNCLISSFKEYKKHPIISFNNLFLEIHPEIISACPQLSVSINTDDQGVFDTSLEYEYALMTSALINVK